MWRWRAGLLSVVLTTGAVVAVAAPVGYPGYQDFGEWIYQAGLLGHVLAGRDSSVASLALYPVPLSLPQLALAACVAVAGPVVGAVLYLLGYGLVAALAIEGVIRKFHLPPFASSLILTGCLVLGSGFWNGYIGTQWGLVILLVYLALDRRRQVTPVVMAGFGMLNFFTHGLALATWGVVALSISVTERRLVRFCMAMVPTALLTIWYLAESDEASGVGAWGWAPAQWLAYKAYTASKLGAYRNLVFRSAGDHDVSPLLYWGGVATNVGLALSLVAVLLLVAVNARALWRDNRALIVAMVSLLAVFAALPDFMVGIVNPGERVLGPAAVLLLVLGLGTEGQRRVGWWRIAPAVLVGVGLLLTGFSAASLPAKRDRGGSPTTVISGWEGRATVLFSHRVDQFEGKLLAADEGRYDQPLAWSTSVLIPR